MKQSMVRTQQVTKALVMASLVAMGACEVADQMVGPEEPPTVVMGRVASVSSSTEASSTPAASAVGGIEVTVRGGLATDITADDGSFRLEVDAQGGPIALRFRRGSLDVELELSGIPSGGELRIHVRLDDSGATILDDDGMDDGLDGIDDGPHDFDGVASLLSLTGQAPGRTVLVELEGSLGIALVQVVEGVTLFDGEGDVLAFTDLLAVLDRSDGRVRIEGDGSLGADGIFVATEIKVEIDEDA